ncbi:MAG: PrsW family glutamic-type intramembrane protease [Pyrinomonadaceae bacterium]
MKLRLTINSGTLAGQVFDLETGFLTVGRGENCSVRFDPSLERIASKQHAFIEAKPDGYYITDNQSTNGTLVNGQRVQTAKLMNGDTVQFGRNGVTGTIAIPEHAPAEPTPDQFRQAQFDQFQQAAKGAPDSLQISMANIGLGNIGTVKPESSKTGLYIGIGSTILAIVFLSLIVVVIMFLSVGMVPAVIASVVAFVPAMLYLFPFIWLDRYDPEPFWLLALAFAWGALVAVIVSYILNSLFGIGVAVTIGGDEGQILGNILAAIVAAPIVEEASKGVGLLILLFFFRRYFDDILDGIVFAGVIALGFATVENVLYYGRAIFVELYVPPPPGEEHNVFFGIFIARGIFSPFAHATFTALIGIGCGLARESHNTVVRILMPILGYIGAVVLHAIWNTMATFLGGFGGYIGLLLGYVVVQVPFFLMFVGFALFVMRRQNKILKEMLAIDIARGLIPEEHGKKAVSAFRSTGWLISGIFNGTVLNRSRYLRAMGKLGLSYWHIQRATAAQGQTASFQQNPLLRDEVLRWRDKV